MLGGSVRAGRRAEVGGGTWGTNAAGSARGDAGGGVTRGRGTAFSRGSVDAGSGEQSGTVRVVGRVGGCGGGGTTTESGGSRLPAAGNVACVSFASDGSGSGEVPGGSGEGWVKAT